MTPYEGIFFRGNEAPDRVQADLMGHKFQRPAYGDGASLEQKRDRIMKIAHLWTSVRTDSQSRDQCLEWCCMRGVRSAAGRDG